MIQLLSESVEVQFFVCTPDWTGVSIQEFIDILNKYLVWYNEKRIKISLGNMSPLEYRRSLGLAA